MRELRNNVAAILRRAAGGERIIVTIDGTPAAQLGPISPDRSPSLDDLVATGLVQAPSRPGGDPEPVEPLDVPVDIRIDDILDELRGR